jgi:hypothetical protein
MGAVCCSKKPKQMDFDAFWDILPIRQVSMVTFKKKFFTINAQELKDVDGFEKLFIREELLLFGDVTMQKLYRDMFIDFAKETDIMKFIYSMLFLCRNDESIDKTIILTEMNKLLGLKLVSETGDKVQYMTKEAYSEILSIYVNLISGFSIQYFKKYPHAKVDHSDVDKIYSKDVQMRLITKRVDAIGDGDKVFLKNIVKTDWPFFCDPGQVRQALLQLYIDGSCKKLNNN